MTRNLWLILILVLSSMNIMGQGLTIKNSLIKDNKATESGAGISVNSGNVKIINNTIVNNQSGDKGAGVAVSGGSVEITNNILWNNKAKTKKEIFVANAIAISILHNAIQQDEYSGQNNNLTINPLFVSDKDFHLQIISPVKGKGLFIVGVNDDVEGKTRGAEFDIGAYELNYEQKVLIVDPLNGSDLNATLKKTLLGAYESAGAGTRIELTPGFFKGALNANISIAKPYLEFAGQQGPVQSLVDLDGNSFLFSARGSQAYGIKLNDFSITGSTTNSILIEGINSSLSNLILYGNQSRGYGAISLIDSDSDITNSILFANRAYDFSGAINYSGESAIRLTNNLLLQNQSLSSALNTLWISNDITGKSVFSGYLQNNLIGSLNHSTVSGFIKPKGSNNIVESGLSNVDGGGNQSAPVQEQLIQKENYAKNFTAVPTYNAASNTTTFYVDAAINNTQPFQGNELVGAILQFHFDKDFFHLIIANNANSITVRGNAIVGLADNFVSLPYLISSFELTPFSLAVDKGDSQNAPSFDILGKARFNQPDIADDLNAGTPPIDIGPIELVPSVNSGLFYELTLVAKEPVIVKTITSIVGLHFNQNFSINELLDYQISLPFSEVSITYSINNIDYATTLLLNTNKVVLLDGNSNQNYYTNKEVTLSIKQNPFNQTKEYIVQYSDTVEIQADKLLVTNLKGVTTIVPLDLRENWAYLGAYQNGILISAAFKVRDFASYWVPNIAIEQVFQGSSTVIVDNFSTYQRYLINLSELNVINPLLTNATIYEGGTIGLQYSDIDRKVTLVFEEPLAYSANNKSIERTLASSSLFKDFGDHVKAYAVNDLVTINDLTTIENQLNLKVNFHSGGATVNSYVLNVIKDNVPTIYQVKPNDRITLEAGELAVFEGATKKYTFTFNSFANKVFNHFVDENQSTYLPASEIIVCQLTFGNDGVLFLTLVFDQVDPIDESIVSVEPFSTYQRYKVLVSYEPFVVTTPTIFYVTEKDNLNLSPTNIEVVSTTTTNINTDLVADGIFEGYESLALGINPLSTFFANDLAADEDNNITVYKRYTSGKEVVLTAMHDSFKKVKVTVHHAPTNVVDVAYIFEGDTLNTQENQILVTGASAGARLVQSVSGFSFESFYFDKTFNSKITETFSLEPFLFNSINAELDLYKRYTNFDVVTVDNFSTYQRYLIDYKLKHKDGSIEIKPDSLTTTITETELFRVDLVGATDYYLNINKLDNSVVSNFLFNKGSRIIEGTRVLNQYLPIGSADKFAASDLLSNDNNIIYALVEYKQLEQNSIVQLEDFTTYKRFVYDAFAEGYNQQNYQTHVKINFEPKVQKNYESPYYKTMVFAGTSQLPVNILPIKVDFDLQVGGKYFITNTAGIYKISATATTGSNGPFRLVYKNNFLYDQQLTNSFVDKGPFNDQTSVSYFIASVLSNEVAGSDNVDFLKIEDRFTVSLNPNSSGTPNVDRTPPPIAKLTLNGGDGNIKLTWSYLNANNKEIDVDIKTQTLKSYPVNNPQEISTATYAYDQRWHIAAPTINNQDYAFYLETLDSAGNKSTSDIVVGQSKRFKQNIFDVADLKALPGFNQVYLGWRFDSGDTHLATDNAIGFLVHRIQGASTKLIAALPVDLSGYQNHYSFVDNSTDLIQNTEYSYSVHVINEKNERSTGVNFDSVYLKDLSTVNQDLGVYSVTFDHLSSAPGFENQYALWNGYHESPYQGLPQVVVLPSDVEVVTKTSLPASPNNFKVYSKESFGTLPEAVQIIDDAHVIADPANVIYSKSLLMPVRNNSTQMYQFDMIQNEYFYLDLTFQVIGDAINSNGIKIAEFKNIDQKVNNDLDDANFPVILYPDSIQIGSNKIGFMHANLKRHLIIGKEKGSFFVTVDGLRFNINNINGMASTLKTNAYIRFGAVGADEQLSVEWFKVKFVSGIPSFYVPSETSFKIVVPGAVTGLTVTPVASTALADVQWVAPADPTKVSAYKIESKELIGWSKIVSSSVLSTQIKVPFKGNFNFRVMALSSSGNKGIPSDWVTANVGILKTDGIVTTFNLNSSFDSNIWTVEAGSNTHLRNHRIFNHSEKFSLVNPLNWSTKELNSIVIDYAVLPVNEMIESEPYYLLKEIAFLNLKTKTGDYKFIQKPTSLQIVSNSFNEEIGFVPGADAAQLHLISEDGYLNIITGSTQLGRLNIGEVTGLDLGNLNSSDNGIKIGIKSITLVKNGNIPVDLLNSSPSNTAAPNVLSDLKTDSLNTRVHSWTTENSNVLQVGTVFHQVTNYNTSTKVESFDSIPVSVYLLDVTQTTLKDSIAITGYPYQYIVSAQPYNLLGESGNMWAKSFAFSHTRINGVDFQVNPTKGFASKWTFTEEGKSPVIGVLPNPSILIPDEALNLKVTLNNNVVVDRRAIELDTTQFDLSNSWSHTIVIKQNDYTGPIWELKVNPQNTITLRNEGPNWSFGNLVLNSPAQPVNKFIISYYPDLAGAGPVLILSYNDKVINQTNRNFSVSLPSPLDALSTLSVGPNSSDTFYTLNTTKSFDLFESKMQSVANNISLSTGPSVLNSNWILVGNLPIEWVSSETYSFVNLENGSKNFTYKLNELSSFNDFWAVELIGNTEVTTSSLPNTSQIPEVIFKDANNAYAVKLSSSLSRIRINGTPHGISLNVNGSDVNAENFGVRVIDSVINAVEYNKYNSAITVNFATSNGYRVKIKDIKMVNEAIDSDTAGFEPIRSLHFIQDIITVDNKEKVLFSHAYLSSNVGNWEFDFSTDDINPVFDIVYSQADKHTEEISYIYNPGIYTVYYKDAKNYGNVFTNIIIDPNKNEVITLEKPANFAFVPYVDSIKVSWLDISETPADHFKVTLMDVATGPIPLGTPEPNLVSPELALTGFIIPIPLESRGKELILSIQTEKSSLTGVLYQAQILQESINTLDTSSVIIEPGVAPLMTSTAFDHEVELSFEKFPYDTAGFILWQNEPNLLAGNQAKPKKAIIQLGDSAITDFNKLADSFSIHPNISAPQIIELNSLITQNILVTKPTNLTQFFYHKDKSIVTLNDKNIINTSINDPYLFTFDPFDFVDDEATPNLGSKEENIDFNFYDIPNVDLNTLTIEGYAVNQAPQWQENSLSVSINGNAISTLESLANINSVPEWIVNNIPLSVPALKGDLSATVIDFKGAEVSDRRLAKVTANLFYDDQSSSETFTATLPEIIADPETYSQSGFEFDPKTYLWYGNVNFQISGSSLKEGYNQIVLSATDYDDAESSLISGLKTIKADGSETFSANQSILVDNQGPTINFISPVLNQKFYGKLIVSGTFEDASGISIAKLFVDSNEIPLSKNNASVSNNTFLFTTSGLTSGNHTVTVTLTDLLGNSSSASENFVYNSFAVTANGSVQLETNNSVTLNAKFTGIANSGAQAFLHSITVNGVSIPSANFIIDNANAIIEIVNLDISSLIGPLHGGQNLFIVRINYSLTANGPIDGFVDFHDNFNIDNQPPVISKVTPRLDTFLFSSGDTYLFKPASPLIIEYFDQTPGVDVSSVKVFARIGSVWVEKTSAFAITNSTATLIGENIEVDINDARFKVSLSEVGKPEIYEYELRFKISKVLNPLDPDNPRPVLPVISRVVPYVFLKGEMALVMLEGLNLNLASELKYVGTGFESPLLLQSITQVYKGNEYYDRAYARVYFPKEGHGQLFINGEYQKFGNIYIFPALKEDLTIEDVRENLQDENNDGLVNFDDIDLDNDGLVDDDFINQYLPVPVENLILPKILTITPDITSLLPNAGGLITFDDSLQFAISFAGRNNLPFTGNLKISKSINGSPEQFEEMTSFFDLTTTTATLKAGQSFTLLKTCPVVKIEFIEPAFNNATTIKYLLFKALEGINTPQISSVDHFVWANGIERIITITGINLSGVTSITFVSKNGEIIAGPFEITQQSATSISFKGLLNTFVSGYLSLDGVSQQYGGVISAGFPSNTAVDLFVTSKIADFNGDNIISQLDLDNNFDLVPDQNAITYFTNNDELTGIDVLRSTEADNLVSINPLWPNQLASPYLSGQTIESNGFKGLLTIIEPKQSDIVGENITTIRGEVGTGILRVELTLGTQKETAALIANFGSSVGLPTFFYISSNLILNEGANHINIKAYYKDGLIPSEGNITIYLDNKLPIVNSLGYEKVSEIFGYRSLYNELMVKGAFVKQGAYKLSGVIEDDQELIKESFKVIIDNTEVSKDLFDINLSSDKKTLNFVIREGKRINLYENSIVKKGATSILSEEDFTYGNHIVTLSIKDKVGNILEKSQILKVKSGDVLVAKMGHQINYAGNPLSSSGDSESTYNEIEELMGFSLSLPQKNKGRFAIMPENAFVSMLDFDVTLEQQRLAILDDAKFDQIPTNSELDGIAKFKDYQALVYGKKPSFSISGNMRLSFGTENRTRYLGGAIEQLSALAENNLKVKVSSEIDAVRNFNSSYSEGTNKTITVTSEVTENEVEKDFSNEYKKEDDTFKNLLAMNLSNNISFKTEIDTEEEDEEGAGSGGGGSSGGTGIGGGGVSGGGGGVAPPPPKDNLITRTASILPGERTIMVGKNATFTLSVTSGNTGPVCGGVVVNALLENVNNSNFSFTNGSSVTWKANSPSMQSVAGVVNTNSDIKKGSFYYALKFCKDYKLFVEGFLIKGSYEKAFINRSYPHPEFVIDDRTFTTVSGTPQKNETTLSFNIIIGDYFAEYSESPKDAIFEIIINGKKVTEKITHATKLIDNQQVEGSVKQKFQQIYTLAIKDIPLEYGLNAIPISVKNELGYSTVQLLKVNIGDKNGNRESKYDYLLNSYELLPQNPILPYVDATKIMGEFKSPRKEIKTSSTKPYSIALNRAPVSLYGRFQKDIFVTDNHPFKVSLANFKNNGTKPVIIANPGETVPLEAKGESNDSQKFKLYVNGLNIIDVDPTHVISSKKFTLKAYGEGSASATQFGIKIISQSGVALTDQDIKVNINNQSAYFDTFGYQVTSDEIEIVEELANDSRFNANKIVLKPGEYILASFEKHQSYALYQKLPDAKTFEAVSGVTPAVSNSLPIPWMSVGYQVYLHNQQLVLSHNLFSIPGRMSTVSPTLSYRSGSLSNSIIGNGWFASWSDHFIAVNENNELTKFLYVSGNGREDYFDVSGSDLKIPKGFTIKAKLNDAKTEITAIQTNGTEILYRQLGQAGVFYKVSVKDRFDNTVKYVYNEFGNMTKIIDDLNRPYEFKYEDNAKAGSRLVEISDFAGLKYTLDNANGKLNKVEMTAKDNKKVTVVYGYNNNIMLDTVTLNGKEFVNFNFETGAEAKFKVKDITLGENDEISESIEVDGTITTVTDFNLVETKYQFRSGNEAMLADSITVDPTGKNITTIFQSYDAEQRLTSVKAPLGNITATEYKVGTDIDKRISGNVKFVKVSKGTRALADGGVGSYSGDYTENFEYHDENKFFQLSFHTASNTVTTTYSYSGTKATLSQISVPSQSGGNDITKYDKYNKYGQLEKMTNPDLSVVEYIYYNSNLKHENVKDLEGYLYQQKISNTGDLKNEIYLTTYGKDHYGRTVSTTPPKGATTDYKYNSIGQLENIIAPPANEKKADSRLITAYTYNKLGAVETITMRNPVATGSVESPVYQYVETVTTNEFDGLNRLTKTTRPVQGDEGVSRNIYETGKARLKSQKSVSENWSHNFYDSAGRVEKELSGDEDEDPTNAFSFPARLSVSIFKPGSNEVMQLGTVYGEVENSTTTYLTTPVLEAEFTNDYLGRSVLVTNLLDDSTATTLFDANTHVFNAQAKDGEGNLVVDQSFAYNYGYLDTSTDNLNAGAKVVTTVDNVNNKVTTKIDVAPASSGGGGGGLGKKSRASSVAYDTYETQTTALGFHLNSSVSDGLRTTHLISQHDIHGNITSSTLSSSPNSQVFWDNQDSPGNLQKLPLTTFNSADKAIEQIIPELNNSTTTVAPSGLGAPGVTKDPVSNVTKNELDQNASVISSKEDASGSNARETKDKVDRKARTSLIFRGNQATKSTFNRAGQPTLIEYFYNASSTSVLGNPTVTETYQYDKLGRTIKYKRKDNTELRYVYYASTRMGGQTPTTVNDRDQLFEVLDEQNRVLRRYLNYNRFGAAQDVYEFSIPGVETYFVLCQYEFYTTPGVGFGQIKSETTSIKEAGSFIGPAVTVGYEYDLAGKRTQLTYPSGKVLNYDYTDGSSLVKITDADDTVVWEQILDNDLRIPLKTKAFDGVSEVAHDYKSVHLGLLKGMHLKVDNNNEGYLSTFDYDERGLKNKTGQWMADSTDFLRDYTYDGLSRLQQSSPIAAAGDKFFNESVILNAFETRSSAVVNGQTIIYTEADDRNRLAEYVVGGKTYSFEYDERGNVTSDGIFDYKWDNFDRLLQAKKHSGNFEEILVGEKLLITNDEGGGETSFAHTLVQPSVVELLQLTPVVTINKVQGIPFDGTEWEDIDFVAGATDIALSSSKTFQSIRVVAVGPSNLITQIKVLRSQEEFKDLNASLPLFEEVNNKHQVTFAFDSNYPNRVVLKRTGGFTSLADIEDAQIYISSTNSYIPISFTAGYTSTSTSEEIIIDLFVNPGEATRKTSEVRFTVNNNGTQVYSAEVYSGKKETSVRYTYDASGRRVLRTYSGGNYDSRPTNTRGVYDGVALIEERTQQSNQIVRRFTYGSAINEPVQVEEDGNTNGSLSDTADKVYIPVLDDRGTMVGVIDGKTKLLIERLYYNSTGLIKSYSTTPNQGDISSETENLDDEGLNIGRSKFISFGWTGMYHEPVTNLYHTLYREYDAVHERWLSEDPAGYADGLNLYGAYMGVNGVDPLGLEDAATCRRYIDEAKETFGRVQHRYNLTKSGLAGANTAAYLKETLRLYDKYQSQKKAAFCQIDAYAKNAFAFNWSPYNYYEEAFKLGDVQGLGSGSRGARYQNVDFIKDNIDENITAINSYHWSAGAIRTGAFYVGTALTGYGAVVWVVRGGVFAIATLGFVQGGKVIVGETVKAAIPIAVKFVVSGGVGAVVVAGVAVVSGPAAPITVPVTEGVIELTPRPKFTRVGRWMSKLELGKMFETGKVQPNFRNGSYSQDIQHVTVPSNPNSFIPPPESKVFVEFDVPTNQLNIHDKVNGWGRIFGPNSLEGRNLNRKGDPLPDDMPSATNIKVIESR